MYFVPRHDVKGERQQRVAGKNRSRIIECFMHRRSSAAEAVIVHRRQIVMYQRIAMDELECCAGHECAGPIYVKQCRRLHNKERAQTLSSIQGPVTHGGDQARRPRRLAAQRRRAQEPVEQRLNVACSCGETIGKAGGIVFHCGIDSGYSRFRKVGSIVDRMG